LIAARGGGGRQRVDQPGHTWVGGDPAEHRRLSPQQPDIGQAITAETWDGWAYLATAIDLHSRALVGWALDTHMRTSLVTEALSMVLRRRQPAADVHLPLRSGHAVPRPLS